MLEKGAVVALPYGVEGFATPKHLTKEDGSQAKVDEKLNFKVIEFNKDSKRIILSHSRTFEEDTPAQKSPLQSVSLSVLPLPRKLKKLPLLQLPSKRPLWATSRALAALKEKLSK